MAATGARIGRLRAAPGLFMGLRRSESIAEAGCRTPRTVPPRRGLAADLGTPPPFHSLVLGPPGGGKGTISKRLSKRFGTEVLSTGDMIRSQIQQGTAIGTKFQALVNEGKLVPAETVMDLLDGALTEYADVDWMLDGFPRSLEQAALLDARHRIDFVVHIDVPFDVIVQRLQARWCHLPSGRIYNLEYNPPAVPGKDDETGEDLVQREDDKPEVVLSRLQLYDDETKPLLDHYGSKGLLRSFSGTESDVIYPQIADFMENELGLPVHE